MARLDSGKSQEKKNDVDSILRALDLKIMEIEQEEKRLAEEDVKDKDIKSELEQFKIEDKK